MALKLKGLMAFLVSFLLGALYSALIVLISRHLWPLFVAWPVTTLLLWTVFWKFNLLRLSGYLAIIPLSILTFEIVRTIVYPSAYAYRYRSLDRSHYIPGVRLVAPKNNIFPEPDGYGRELKEILIGKDGFRADSNTGQGNPERCSLVLIGDSMIYGSGLPYLDTLRPALATMRADACVFGVTGNAPIDYFSTLQYVAKRIEKEAHIAIYLYAYNDFVNLNKYMRRRFGALSNSLGQLGELTAYADDWRRTTFIYGLFRSNPNISVSQWQIKLGEAKTLQLYSPRDPARYTSPPLLNKGKRASLKFFFQNLHHFVRGQSWHVSIVIIPDNDEVMANLARQSPAFLDLDPRRADALVLCRTFPFGCEDLAAYLYQRMRVEAKNPYLTGDRHFSAFGTRLVAEHFLALTKQRLSRSTAEFAQPN